MDRILDETLHRDGAVAAFDLLIERFRSEGRYPELFEARLMKRRFELGLPLLAGGEEIPPESRGEYEPAVVAAAREAGQLFLARGEIGRAWPYFRALGEKTPVREAIDAVDAETAPEDVVGVALGEGVHPRKGFEVMLKQSGICQSITAYGRMGEFEDREQCLALLMGHLERELHERLKATVEAAEGPQPEGVTIEELVTGRDWMFGEYDYYVDTSHLTSLIRYAIDSSNADTWRRALGFAVYGSRLSGNFQGEGEPPFDDFFPDHAVYLRALLGEGVEGCMAHFESKIAGMDLEQIGTYPAQVVVRMFGRLGRWDRAIEVFERHVSDADPAYLSCPDLAELCRLAGDWSRLERLAEAEGNPLRLLAARLSAATRG